LCTFHSYDKQVQGKETLAEELKLRQQEISELRERLEAMDDPTEAIRSTLARVADVR